MGSGRWSPSDWTTYSSTTKTRSVDKIYTSRSLNFELDPNGIGIRESRDSVANPESTAIIVDLDVTGSMGMLADVIAKDGLGTLIEEILERKPVTDPHIMIMANGDAHCDRAPLQVTQFEATIVLTEQLQKIYLEHGGGGNHTESYDFPWYFAAQHTSIDCFEKRNKKGYLFTIGDEEDPAGLTKEQIKRFIGDDVERDYSAKELLAMAQRMYNVFHVVVEEGSYVQSLGRDHVIKAWNKILGQNVIPLSDHKNLAEVLVSVIQVHNGEDKKKVAASWKGTTSVVVSNAVKDLVVGSHGSAAKAGVVRLS